ncbi:hypothetical protein H5410_005486 [Solanum commersonii]|uniref:Uncharacterized protein n=1 Tax=Solanum commersonii TaxID=4109 RepID=A0A9J6A7P6_SOLCO|nr:hypothetical protein H5410_005486 [Solanum commersonii]
MPQKVINIEILIDPIQIDLIGKEDLDEGLGKNEKSKKFIVYLIDLQRIGLGEISQRLSATISCTPLGSESDYDDDDYSESCSETDKPETSGNTQSATIDACKCRGDICSCENDEFYKLQSQFEDMNINTITSNNMIELLKKVTDNTLREKIIQLAANNKASSSNHVVIHDTSFDDLKGEIEQLKQEIKSLKQNQIICDHRLTQIKSSTNKGKNIVEENTLTKPINIDPKQNIFLGMMQIVTAHKWYVKCTILINNAFSITDIAMIDSGANGKVNPIQRSIDFASKFPDVITDRTQLQKFLESLNYISPFYKKLSRDVAPLYDRLKRIIKLLGLIIVETDAFNIGFGGILKQINPLCIIGRNSPIIQRGGMSLVKLKTSQKEASSSSIHLEDIPEDNPLYAELRAYLSQKEKGDIFASIAKEDINDIKSYEKKIVSSMKERKMSHNKIPTNFTYWDYINAFSKVLYYNNERHKHTWFVKVCAKIFAETIPNWFLNWWSYHEFSIPWIHKWTPKVDFTEEQIPCLYRTYYNNFWDKLMKKDPKTKALYGQKLLDSITQKIQDYSTNPHKSGLVDSSVKHIASRISIQDGNKEEMINEYVNEVNKNLLVNINHYEKSDYSMRSETSDDVQEDTAQLRGDTLQRTKDFLFGLKEKDTTT